MWLDRVEKSGQYNLDIRWKNFQLQQANSKGSERKVWDSPDRSETRSMVAAVAGEAAMRQGKVAHSKFHLALLTARHGPGERASLNDEEVVAGIAAEVGLDETKFREDMKNEALARNVELDHTEAVERHGVFGTPTFVFDNGHSVYLKSFVPPKEESVAFFGHFLGMMRDMPFVGELKRPQPPWPKGAVG